MQTQIIYHILRATLLAVLFWLPVNANKTTPLPATEPGPAVVTGEPVTPREFVGDLRQLPQIQPGEHALQQPPGVLPDLSSTLTMPGPVAGLFKWFPVRHIV